MDQGEVFLKVGSFPGRIKTVHAQKFMRPVAEETRGVQRPASRVAEPLSFGEKVLASLKRFFGALAILDVGRDPIPPDDVSIFISERHSAVQLPAILPIRAAGTHLTFVRLAGSNRFHPSTCMSLKII